MKKQSHAIYHQDLASTDKWYQNFATWYDTIQHNMVLLNARLRWRKNIDLSLNSQKHPISFPLRIYGASIVMTTHWSNPWISGVQWFNESCKRHHAIKWTHLSIKHIVCPLWRVKLKTTSLFTVHTNIVTNLHPFRKLAFVYLIHIYNIVAYYLTLSNARKIPNDNSEMYTILLHISCFINKSVEFK